MSQQRRSVSLYSAVCLLISACWALIPFFPSDFPSCDGQLLSAFLTRESKASLLDACRWLGLPGWDKAYAPLSDFLFLHGRFCMQWQVTARYPIAQSTTIATSLFQPRHSHRWTGWGRLGNTVLLLFQVRRHWCCSLPHLMLIILKTGQLVQAHFLFTKTAPNNSAINKKNIPIENLRISVNVYKVP